MPARRRCTSVSRMPAEEGSGGGRGEAGGTRQSVPPPRRRTREEARRRDVPALDRRHGRVDRPDRCDCGLAQVVLARGRGRTGGCSASEGCCERRARGVKGSERRAEVRVAVGRVGEDSRVAVEAAAAAVRASLHAHALPQVPRPQHVARNLRRAGGRRAGRVRGARLDDVVHLRRHDDPDVARAVHGGRVPARERRREGRRRVRRPIGVRDVAASEEGARLRRERVRPAVEREAPALRVPGHPAAAVLLSVRVGLPAGRSSRQGGHERRDGRLEPLERLRVTRRRRGRERAAAEEGAADRLEVGNEGGKGGVASGALPSSEEEAGGREGV